MNTGTYIFDKTLGKVIKVSDSVPCIKKTPSWGRKMDADGERSRAFHSLENQGKLAQVNDKECQAGLGRV